MNAAYTITSNVNCSDEIQFQFHYSDALCSLVSFVQFEKREKYPRRSVTFRFVCYLYFKLVYAVV